MHLLNVDTRELEDFDGDGVPEYAILSHTWGHPDEEILFHDLSPTPIWDASTTPPADSPKAIGWKKLDAACRQAVHDGLHYIWIDTCCIDKSSSANLSEAIISMFRWYANSVVCYAYLADVYAGTNPRSDQAMEDFRESRWFTRGWTLQELLAPADVRFFDARWVNLGGRHLLRETISAITGIHLRFLPASVSRQGWDPQQHIAVACVAERMSWAAKRRTSRVEDIAYCLLGIFDVAMPILYGEGDRAFARLQQGIMEVTDDCTLLAWNYQVELPRPSRLLQHTKPSILAPSPAAFEHCRGIVPRRVPRHGQPSFHMSQRGLKIKAPIVQNRLHKEMAYLLLACGPLSPPSSMTALAGVEDTHLLYMAIPLLLSSKGSDVDGEEYWRPTWSRPTLVTKWFVYGTVGAKPKAVWKKILVRRPSVGYDLHNRLWLPFSLISPSPTDAVLDAYPAERISFNRVISSRNTDGHQGPSVDATPTTQGSSLLDKFRRASKQDNSSSSSSSKGAAATKVNYYYVCLNTKRLVYARIHGMHILIHAQFPISSTAEEDFIQRLHALEWPRKPQIKVFRLPSAPAVEDMQHWDEVVKLHFKSELVLLEAGYQDGVYVCDGPDGSPVQFALNLAYEQREQVDRSGEAIAWDFMPIVKVTYAGGEVAADDEGVDDADAWSVAETLAQE